MSKCPPLLGEWDPAVFVFLPAELLRRYLAPWGGEKNPEAWRQLLRATYQGQIVEMRDGTRKLVPFSVTPGQVYERACREAQEYLVARQQNAAGDAP